jgi:hypothetical protein
MPPTEAEANLELRRPVLRPTDVTGVYINEAGVEVDQLGIAVDLRKMYKRDKERIAELAEDGVGPLALMRSIVADPRLPLSTRLDAANKLAPYTDRKQPTSIEGGDKPIQHTMTVVPDIVAALKALSPEDRALLVGMHAKIINGGAS